MGMNDDNDDNDSNDNNDDNDDNKKQVIDSIAIRHQYLTGRGL